MLIAWSLLLSKQGLRWLLGSQLTFKISLISWEAEPNLICTSVLNPAICCLCSLALSPHSLASAAGLTSRLGHGETARVNGSSHPSGQGPFLCSKNVQGLDVHSLMTGLCT